MDRTWLLAAGGGTAVFGGLRLLRRLRTRRLEGDVALVTGASRGLGMLIARELARRGCRLVICARDEEELERARRDLAERGADVLSVACDVGDRQQVERMIARANERFGRIDLLVNNAGVMQVASVEDLLVRDFEEAVSTMYWGVVFPTLAVLPGMRERGSGRIVNITSIGGRVSVPHLLPYSSAKFAAVGFSEGLRAELAGTGITVTTVTPGLMRTGSFVNALFGGRAEQEIVWFAAAASLPLLTMDAERAARRVVDAAARGDADLVLTVPARVIMWVHGLFPGSTARVLGLVNRLILPASGGRRPSRLVPGRDALSGARLPMRDRILGQGLDAAERFHEHPGPQGAATRPLEAGR